ncbi:Tc toxin subunit A [Enterobacter asburiae]|nr:Tc toxin subunit A [Enterobacter asburiae]
MQTNQTTRELYQSHANVLVSLGYKSQVDIAQHSFATFRQACRSLLSWGESRSIYVQAQRHVAMLSAKRRKILKHANPQLKNALRLAINPMQQQTRDYETLFGQRADAYVPTSSVASMFSPAGYLTELYREGKQLHTSDKPQHLDKRRPDLQSLLLSQSNQDVEFTTLALSNGILLSSIKANIWESEARVRENLNNTAYPFDLPYHIPFASIETALAVQNTNFEALAHALAPSQTIESFPATTRAAYANHLPPGLCDLLLAPITSNEAQLNDMLMRHFGSKDIEKLSDAEYFCQRVGLSREELNDFLSLPSFKQSHNAQPNHNIKVPLLQPPHAFGGQYLNATSKKWLGFRNGRISRVVVEAPSDIIDRLNILPSINDSCITFAAISSTIVDTTSRSTYIDIKIDGAHFTKGFPDSWTDGGVWTVPLHEDGYRVFEFEVTKSDFKLQIGIGDQNIFAPGTWYPSSEPAQNNFFVTFSSVGAADLIKLSQLIRYSQKTNLSPAALDSLIALSQGSPPPAITKATLQLTARTLECQQRYALSEDDALVLAGADINAYAPAGELSQFDRLFNNPPLNNVAFTINDGNDTISFAPADTTYTQERAVLKRALGVDDAGLATLAAIVDHDDTWARSLTHLSTLYRVGLWAQVHGLSPQELKLLLQLNGKTADLLDTPHDITNDYLDAVYNTSEWLAAQQLSVAALNVMTTKAYPDTMTPEIDSFVRTLYQVIKDKAVGRRFEVASVSSPTAVAGEDLVADVLLTRAIYTSDTGDFAKISFKINDNSTTSADYDESTIQAECLDVDGNVLKSQQDIQIGSDWTVLEAMPVGTVRVRLTLPTVADNDTTDEQLAIQVARHNNVNGIKTGIATITPVGTQTTRATPPRAASPRAAALTPNPLHQLLAPHLAGKFGLDNVESAIAQQVWIEQVAADQGLSLNSMTAFSEAITGYCEGGAPTAEESAQLTTFCQALGQLAFIIKREKMSAAELNVVVYHPYMLGGTLVDKLSLRLETMQSLSRLSALLLRVGKGASECLTLLGMNQLNVAALARWLDAPQSEVMQAALCVGASSNMMNATQAVFTLDWLAQAATLGVSVQAVRDLLASPLDQSYIHWQKVAGAVQAGVAKPERGQMNAALDEALSTALCAYFMSSVAPTLPSSIPMQNRDDLFCYLLIDNQVSSQIITSPIAEAISSVQLYINRCLQGMEDNIDTSQLTEGFFLQWEQYNKRYSTWAGVSQLAWYPENYIDPTLRYNQSSLQRQLLNDLNQSQLNKDSVETAYRNYLDGFEDIANLNVLCGYHQGAELDKGMSYFVGRSNETPALYYCRSLNQEASDGVGGYVASAWTDWEEVSGQVNAVNDEVRPVLFNNRLYIASVIEEMVSDGVTADGEPIQNVQYSLQLTYRKINGNWAPSVKFVLPAIPGDLFDTTTKQPKFNLYLSYHPVYDAILFMLYDPSLGAGRYDAIAGDAPVYGGFIYNNMQLAMVQNADHWRTIYSLFSNNLNNRDASNKVIRYINAQKYSINVTPAAATNTTDSNWLVVRDVNIVDEVVDNLSVPPKLSYTAQGTIEIKNASTAPNAVVTPGSISDQSGNVFDVTAGVTSAKNNDSFVFTASISVTTQNSDSVFSVANTSINKINGPGFIYNVSYTNISEGQNGKVQLVVGFIWANTVDHNLPKRLIVKNKADNRVLYDDVISTGLVTAQISFTDSELALQAPGAVVYVVDETIGTNQQSRSELTVNYTAQQLAPALSVSFGTQQQNIASGPADVHNITLRHTIPFSSNGSQTNQVQAIEVTGGSALWQQTYTLGHTAYSRGRTFTYNWGEGDRVLPVSGTTNIGADYDYPIPGNGLHQYRTLTVKQDGAVVFSQIFEIDVTSAKAAVTNPDDYMQIIRGDNQASYLEKNTAPKRTRLNTLFARELVNRAKVGLDYIFDWGTQQLQEPALGAGGYVDVFIPACANPKYAVYWINDRPRVAYLMAEGRTHGEGLKLRLHLPFGNVIKANFAYLRVDVDGYVYSSYANFYIVQYDFNSGVISRISPPAEQFIHGQTVSISPIQTEPMDFSGANGIYFWELFYYTPMMAAEKLLQSQDFEEAERWLNYVFNPAGYFEGEYPNRRHVDRQWNTRPLEEDTAWDDTQTDNTDPDVVAQADPMHYKVATFMKLLDILIARGDMAYRLLERDTLAEAKMWYLAALQLLGPQPDLPELGNWGDPSLAMAASETSSQQILMLMERLMPGDVLPLNVPAEQPQWEIAQGDAQAEMSGENSPATRTANSLTALFLPSENDKLSGYWQTLAQRLFNLRHNLSIDGQPLTLPLYAPSADPKALQAAAAAASAGGASSLPNASLSILRFPQILESARELVGQLTQYGGTLSSVLERKDAEALGVMLQTQAKNLYGFGLQVIEQNLLALDEEQSIVEIGLEQQKATMKRMGEYYDQNISPAETAAISLQTLSSTLQYAKAGFELGSAGLKSIPNIFGLAVGGGDFSAFSDLGWKSLDLQSKAGLITADVITTTEAWRRRREEWAAERDAAERQIRISQAQLRNIDLQKQGQRLQKAELEQQQANTQAHYDFLTTKFSNEALYSWMQGRLSALYYQFYDLSIARCLKAQLGFQWETGSSVTFIQPGAWDSNHAGLLCGESLMLNLAQMESAYLEWDARTLEVSRTVSMAQEMGLDSAAFNNLVNGVLSGLITPPESLHSLTFDGEVFRASIDLASLNIANDYPNSVVTRSRYRRIKQVSVSLPALLGPYQDIQAVLGYSVGGGSIPPSCLQTAISHGSNDSGQFQLDFNDSKYLPFEGLPVDGSDNASLTLSFPNACNDCKQRVILQSLNDIVLHIRYTMRD